MISTEYAVYRLLSSSSMNPTPGLHTFHHFITVGQTSLNLPWATKSPSTEFLDISEFGLINNTSMLISPNACHDTISQLLLLQHHQIASYMIDHAGASSKIWRDLSPHLRFGVFTLECGKWYGDQLIACNRTKPII